MFLFLSRKKEKNVFSTFNEIISQMEDTTIVKMGYAIQNYLEKSGIKSAKPAELMDPLIELGFFR